MRSFLTILTDVLNEEETIPELPLNQMRACHPTFQQLPHKLPQILLTKLLRLQTLRLQVSDDAGLPDDETIEQISQQTKSYPGEVMAKSMEINDDAKQRHDFLARLIVEVVRDAFPPECEYLNSEYFVIIPGTLERGTINRAPGFD